jgi:hypothetical protein
VCCALLLLLGSPVSVLAQDSTIRMTMSSPWGHNETLTISETPSGATIVKQWQRPRNVKDQVRPAMVTEEGQLTISPEQFTAMTTQLLELGITRLEDYVQPNIEDAATYHFEGELDGTPFEFSVYGVPADFENQSYFRVLRMMRENAREIEMREVQR